MVAGEDDLGLLANQPAAVVGIGAVADGVTQAPDVAQVLTRDLVENFIHVAFYDEFTELGGKLVPQAA